MRPPDKVYFFSVGAVVFVFIAAAIAVALVAWRVLW